MPLSRYQRLAYRLLGSSVAKTAQSNVHLRISLQKAHIYLRPEVYLGYSYLNMAVAFGVSMGAILVLAFLSVYGVLPLPISLFVFLAPMPMALAATIYLLSFVVPDLRASSRARDIDARLPYALNYIATMASAGIPPDKVFAGLAKQSVYGEVANEAAWISRDLNLLGLDLVSALTAAIDRSPSLKFQDFLQGAITAVTSGGDLKKYFRSKSEQFMYENRQQQKGFLDNLGILAESFVTVVVAGPVFLLVLLSVMTMFGSNGRETLNMGYMVILLMLPMAQMGFALAIKSVTPEV